MSGGREGAIPLPEGDQVEGETRHEQRNGKMDHHHVLSVFGEKRSL